MIIATYFNDDFIRPYVGDMLVVILIYCFIRIIIPSKLSLLPLYVFIFALSVEVLQYLQIVKFLGLEDNSLAKIIIGSTFDWKDIICYAVGCILIFTVEKSKHKS